MELWLLLIHFIKENPKSEFYDSLKEKGMTITDYEFPLHLIILEYISSHQLPSTFIILLVIIFIAILYDQLSSVKEMSIKRMHGFTSSKIIGLQVLKITKIFILQFIVITFTVTIGLLKEPLIIFADEATGALENDNKYNILELISEFKGKSTILIVTHEEDVMKYCDRNIQLHT